MNGIVVGSLIPLCIAVAVAQTAILPGTLSVTLRYGTDAPIPTASIELFRSNSQTLVRRASVAADGGFTFRDLSPGVYRFEVAAAGFFREHADGIRVTAGQETVIPV